MSVVSTASPPPDSALILVVDDQPANIQAVGALLSNSGFEVMPALSGEQALARCAQRRPDLILLDMLMPGMSGLEVCARLRADPALADLPVIFLTAAHERDALTRAFQAGAVDYVSKPFVAEELLARVRTHVDLKRTRDHLARIARECTELTQLVAHDLKSPLSSIQFSASMMLRQGATRPERMSELAENVQSSAASALHFIEGYLEQWAEGELKRRIQLGAVALPEVVDEALKDITAAAEIRGMSVARSHQGALAVQADRTAVRHVLVNLLSNAVRYADAGQTVEVHTGPGRPGYGKVMVLDRGPGIAPEEQKQLFRRYVRLGKAGRTPDSSGLGLAISKQEINQLGGHLWYEDRPGGGAIFAFDLPLAVG